ncbi:hypothetical protein [Marinococcus sp. PL1-022]|uniref:hypothetical protein n=1 Tax=Marinococcus sp. PL1-022 TaxID=3095363 RepID=UPI0029C33094|nr:hypothetical protein [Marinococcus sp. PL1-022]MDX6153125.1 hypothetical protein [Marinococcus sp. PL1-022]
MKRKLLLGKELLLIGLTVILVVSALIFIQREPEMISHSYSTDEASRSSANEESDGTEETEADEPEEKAEETKPEQVYKPVEPESDSIPLKDQLEQEELESMPESEAGTGESTRMVPFGETQIKGTEDQTDGPLKEHRLVTYYGHPNSTNMGILGEMEPDALMEKLKEQTQAYSNADPSHPAVPTIELIATAAQRDPGSDGNYVRMTPPEQIDKYAKLAKENDALLMLDVQLGKDSVLNQVKSLEKWLKLPYVQLAIDTEFQVGEGETPGVELGQVNGADVQKAVDYLTEMVEENNLPDKMVLVHQFTDAALTNKEAIQPTDHVEVALNFDGWGGSAVKMAKYRDLVRNEPVQYGGFKVFYDKDEPVMSPEEVIQLDPAPAVVNYQ